MKALPAEMKALPVETLTSCKGLFFKGHINAFFVARDNLTKIERRESLVLMKRRSCPGCAKCNSFLHQMQDTIYNKTLVLPEIEEDRIYSMKWNVTSRDIETGVADDWEIEVFKIK